MSLEYRRREEVLEDIEKLSRKEVLEKYEISYRTVEDILGSKQELARDIAQLYRNNYI